MRKLFTAAVVDQYVGHLSVRTAMTRHVYRCVLGGFVRFVNRAASGRLSQATIQHWLQDRCRVWPRHLILHRARLVDRFLDWAVEHRKLSVNPLAELRKNYSPHTAPIIRALLSAYLLSWKESVLSLVFQATLVGS